MSYFKVLMDILYFYFELIRSVAFLIHRSQSSLSSPLVSCPRNSGYGSRSTCNDASGGRRDRASHGGHGATEDF